MNETLHVGLDVGSTTVKIIVMDKNKNTLYKNYQRHFSDTKNTVCKVLEDLVEKYKEYKFIYISINRFWSNVCSKIFRS